MKNLFAVETYQGCRVTSPDLRTLVVDGVRGTDLRIVFQQHIEHWTIRLSATAYFPAETPPNHAPLCSGVEINSDIIDFWSRLSDLRFEQETQNLDDRVRRACRIVDPESRSASRPRNRNAKR